MSKLELVIVILNWNGYDDTRWCLESVYRSQKIQFRVVLVDNGSSDDSVNRLQAQFTGLEFIALPENIGYAAGNNVGLRWALQMLPEAVLLLNNDTVLAEDCLRQMFDCARNRQRIGAVVPKIYYLHDPTRLWYAGGGIHWWRVSVSQNGFRQSDSGQWDEPRPIQFATGCALLLKATAAENIGFFDEGFYSYYEDLDYSLRLQREGYEIYYCPHARLWHRVGAGTHGNEYSPYYLYYQTRNRIRAFVRYRRKLYFIYAHLINILLYFVMRIFYILWVSRKKRLLQIRAVVCGYWDSLRGKTGADKRWEQG